MRGLGLKLFLATAAMVVLTLGGALLLVRMRAGQAADAAIDQGLVATQSAIEDALDGRSRTLERAAQVLARVPTYISRIEEALRTGTRGDLLDAASEFRDQSGADWAMIVDAGGVLQAWTRAPEASGVELGESPLVGDALTGTPARGTWIESTPAGDSLYQAVSVPLAAENAPVAGALIVAVPLDNALAERLKRQTGSEVVFVSFDTLGAPHVHAATVPREQLEGALRERYTGTGGTVDSVPARLRVLAGMTWIGAAGALRTASGLIVGEYAGLRAREEALAPFAALQQSFVYAFAGAVAIALLISLLLARQITGPLRRLVGLTRDVAEGRYTGQVDIRASDEVGELASAFQGMVAELREKQKLVEFLGSSATVARTQVIPTGSQPTSGDVGVGTVLNGRYELRQQLGAGGMGVVFRAYDRELKEPVAIKTLRPELVGDAVLLERFKQEIRLARQISHPNVVRTHDLGVADGLYFLTMEFVEGSALDEVIRRRGALPLAVTLAVGRQLLRALEVAHAQGVVHRDIKPQNLVVDAQGFLKVMDFGIARLVEGRQAARPKGEALTAEGSIIGTPQYMAPEQLMGESVDGRADLYAAGLVLFECATGRRMVEGESFGTVLLKQVQEPPTDPRTLVPGLPGDFCALVLKALAKRPDERWATAAEFQQALERIRP